MKANHIFAGSWLWARHWIKRQEWTWIVWQGSSLRPKRQGDLLQTAWAHALRSGLWCTEIVNETDWQD